MPIYEYRCLDCRRRVSVLVRSISQEVSPKCDRCGGANLKRLVSTFAVHRSAGESLDDVPDSAFEDVDENDPASVSRWMKRVKRDMGDEVTPEFDEMMESLESDPTGLEAEDAGDDGGDDDS